MGVVKIGMLKWMCGDTRRNRIQNDDIYIQENIGVVPIEVVWTHTKKVTKGTSEKSR